jgi:hypothetical protein
VGGVEAQMEGASVQGGGLRHGAPEWHVTYRHEGLFRLLVFNVEEDDFGDLRLWVHVGATDEEGGWAQRDLGRAILHRSTSKYIQSRDLEPLVAQARELADSFSQDDLDPLTIGWGDLSGFQTDRDDVGENGPPGAGRESKKSAKRAAAKKSAKKVQKKTRGTKKSTKKRQKKAAKQAARRKS